jgi:hypothetical protein
MDFQAATTCNNDQCTVPFGGEKPFMRSEIFSPVLLGHDDPRLVHTQSFNLNIIQLKARNNPFSVEYTGPSPYSIITNENP